MDLLGGKGECMEDGASGCACLDIPRCILVVRRGTPVKQDRRRPAIHDNWFINESHVSNNLYAEAKIVHLRKAEYRSVEQSDNFL